MKFKKIAEFLLFAALFPTTLNASVGFTTTSYSAAEDSGTIVVSVSSNESLASFEQINVAYSISAGTADNADFTVTNGVLSFSSRSPTTQTFAISITPDSILEPNETINLSLDSCTFISEGSTDCSNINISFTPNTAQAVILNDDSPTTTTTDLSEIEDLTPNQQAIADIIDDICVTATGELLVRCQELLNSGMSTTELVQALDSILPAQVAAQGSNAIDFGFQQLQVIHGRIASLRNNDNGQAFSLSGFTINTDDITLPIGNIAETLLYDALAQAAEENDLRDSPLGFFIKGQISFGDKDRTSQERGFTLDAKSITLGIDYRFTDQLVAGIAGGYGHTNSDYDQNGGDTETDSGNFSIYGSFFLPRDFYLDWILGYSFNNFENNRNIQYTNFSSSAESNADGAQYGGSLGFGKDLYIKSVFINPYVRFEYLQTTIDEYSETGGGGLALRIMEQSIDSMATTVGGQINKAISMPWGVISPGIRFEWRHQFMDDERTIYSQFINTGANSGLVATRTESPDRDYFNLGASVSLTLPEGRAAFLRYETRLAQDNISNHTIEASVRIPF